MSRSTILCGSPKRGSGSLKFAQELFEEKIEEDPNREVTLVSLNDMDICGCCGCDKCKTSYKCVVEDDMAEVLDIVKQSDEIIVVTPIYMAGVPSQLKAALDRFQPMFWEGCRHSSLKPAFLYLFGNGNDPYGDSGAILTLKSALHVAGFEVKDVKTKIN